MGTWKLEEWRARDSLGVWHRELGDAPRGYFVYGANGVRSIHLMHEDGAGVTGCGQDAVFGVQRVENEEFLVAPRCYAGYFGTYRIENDPTVVHLPEGGTVLRYIDTEQPRRFEIRGDSLWIERSDSVCRLLLRVR